MGDSNNRPAILALPGTFAFFEIHDDNIDERRRPVYAFNDEGEPLVAGEQKLVRAADLAGFKRFFQVEPTVAVLPGGGWRYHLTEDDETTEGPVVGFTIDANGESTPLISDGYGTVPMFAFDPDDIHLVPPDSQRAPRGPARPRGLRSID